MTEYFYQNEDLGNAFSAFSSTYFCAILLDSSVARQIQHSCGVVSRNLLISLLQTSGDFSPHCLKENVYEVVVVLCWHIAFR